MAMAFLQTDNQVLDYPGAAPPPPGVIPNLENPSDQGHAGNIAGLTICIASATIFFALRVYIKLWVTRKILLEDVTCFLAWLGVVMYGTATLLMTRHGEGFHTWDISRHDYSRMLFWLYFGSMFYGMGAFFAKMTLLLLLARVFAIRRMVSLALHAFIVVLFCAYVTITVIKIFICNPIKHYWIPSLPGTCMNQRKLFTGDTAMAMVSDFVILLVPIPLALSMHVPWRKKLKIALLLSAGGVATATTVVRFVKVINFIHSKDLAKDFVVIDILSIAEITIGLICSCLPSINIFYERRRGSQLSPNSPRTSASKPWQKGSQAITWNWLGTVDDDRLPTNCVGMTSTDMTKPAATHVQTQTSVPLDYDLELSPFSNPQISHQDECSSAGWRQDFDITHPREHGLRPLLTRSSKTSDHYWFSASRANSDDGKQEGWLKRRNSTGGGIVQQMEGPRGPNDWPLSATISMELAKVSGNRPWSRIWDGQCNSDTSAQADTKET